MKKINSKPDLSIKDKGSYYNDLWQRNFVKLKAFKKSNGHCCVPQKYDDDPSFGLWAWRQRMLKNCESYQKWFNPERAAQLDDIGFVWNIEEYNWWNMFEELRKFHRKNGHCNPGKLRGQYSKLANWIYHQRTYSKQHPEWYSAKKIKSLTKLGLFEEHAHKTWDERFKEMKQFRAKFGHCDTTRHKKDYHSLNLWRQTMRERYISGKLEQFKIDKLNQIGFIWKIKDRDWNAKYEQLKTFIKRNKNDESPYATNRKLSDWIYAQKGLYKKKLLHTDRVNKLKEIDFFSSVLFTRTRGGKSKT